MAKEAAPGILISAIQGRDVQAPKRNVGVEQKGSQEKEGEPRDKFEGWWIANPPRAGGAYCQPNEENHGRSQEQRQAVMGQAQAVSESSPLEKG